MSTSPANIGTRLALSRSLQSVTETEMSQMAHVIDSGTGNGQPVPHPTDPHNPNPETPPSPPDVTPRPPDLPPLPDFDK
jgi:hypothetical protein